MTPFRAAVVLVCLISLSVQGADVPEFRGADRTGIYPETGLLERWPEEGPPLLWESSGFGIGFTSPVIVKDRIYLTGTLDRQESFVFVLDRNGKEIERIGYGLETTAESAPGSRCTPTIDGNDLFVISGPGVVTAIDLAASSIRWQVNILERFNGPQTEWHLSESPIVDGERVICTPGGEDAAMVALDRNTGETLWKSSGLTEMTSHVCPLLVEHKGRKLVFTETAKHLICVDATSGELLWKREHETEWDIHAVTPIYRDGLLYYVAGYKSGGGLLELSDDGSDYSVRWMDTELDCQHHGVVYMDGYLYGTSHHRGGGRLVCLDWETGEMMWADKAVRQSSIIAADGLLYAYEDSRRGTLRLINPSPEGLDIRSEFSITGGPKEHWVHPVISDGRLYMRHGDTLRCYDLRKP